MDIWKWRRRRSFIHNPQSGLLEKTVFVACALTAAVYYSFYVYFDSAIVCAPEYHNVCV
jgi:hypothetical protein